MRFETRSGYGSGLECGSQIGRIGESEFRPRSKSMPNSESGLESVSSVES